MTIFVLDNSVSMRWCFADGDRAYADNVLQVLIAEGNTAVVPVIWRYEVSHVLAGALRRGTLTAEQADYLLWYLQELNIAMDRDGCDYLLNLVHAIALTYGLTTYDAAYLELALRRKLPLASLDQQLRQACIKAGGTLLEFPQVAQPAI